MGPNLKNISVSNCFKLHILRQGDKYIVNEKGREVQINTFNSELVKDRTNSSGM